MSSDYAQILLHLKPFAKTTNTSQRKAKMKKRVAIVENSGNERNIHTEKALDVFFDGEHDGDLTTITQHNKTTSSQPTTPMSSSSTITTTKR